MVHYSRHGSVFESLDYSEIDERGEEVARKIQEKTGEGSDFLGWLDYASKLPDEEIDRIIQTAKHIRENYEALVVVGIGGSYLGARAVIEAINGFFPDDKFEVIYLGNTLSSTYTYQVLRHLKDKRIAVNVISKSGTTTEPAVAFRMVKERLIERFGKEYLKDAIYATTDDSHGALHTEAMKEGYTTFVIPDDIGGRFSVITPVGLLPIACANIDIREFIRGVRAGEKAYSLSDYRKNPAYLYGATRYLLYSMGQFIQQGSHILFETIIKEKHPIADHIVPYDEDNLDNLNYLSGKRLSYINDQAFHATLKAHTEGHSPANVLEIEKMDAYNLGDLFYFFFRATAFSAYLLGVNPFNQPGVEVYKKNMFKLLGKPGVE